MPGRAERGASVANMILILVAVGALVVGVVLALVFTRLLGIQSLGAAKKDADDLLKNESLTPGMLDFLSGCVEARLNIVVSGGSGEVFIAVGAGDSRDRRQHGIRRYALGL